MGHIIFSVLTFVFELLCLLGALSWLVYGLCVVWLGAQGWRRLTWNEKRWPFFFRRWQKIVNRKVVDERDTFVEALRATKNDS